MRVLVTGATGFLGGHVLPALAREGVALRALARPGARALPAEVERIEGDLGDFDALARAAEGCDAIVHMGALVDPAEQADADAVDRVNRAAAIELARLARAGGATRFVFVSSIAAMGFSSGLATPRSPCAPTTPYGRAKLAAERGILALETGAFAPIVLRPPTIYGPGERYNFLAWARAVDRGLFRVIGPGTNVVPLASAENVARALAAAAMGRVPSGVHLVADAARYSMLRVHRAIAAALGLRAPRTRIPLTLARAAGTLNELASRAGAPALLSRARVRTLTVDQPFDVSSLLGAGVALDAPLERAVAETIAEYREAGLVQ